MPGLTDLEAAVLGVIWSDGPCTAYAVRKQFQQSLSSHWSASTGSIYPLVHRLAQRTLLTGRPRRSGRRPGQEYTITSAGRKALRGWVGPPVERAAVDGTFDPLRTRTMFLGVLDREELEQWLDSAATELKRLEKATLHRLAELEAEGNRFTLLATRNALGEGRSRKAWLATVRQELLSTSED